VISKLKLGDISVDVILKDIKNVHLSVYPPTGRVRISAPSHMSMDTIRVFAISKLDWIKKQQSELREQKREAQRDFVERESHFVWGKRYLLSVTKHDQAPHHHPEGQQDASDREAANRSRQTSCHPRRLVSRTAEGCHTRVCREVGATDGCHR